MIEKVIVNVNGRSLHLELGHDYTEWAETYNGNADVWDILISDILLGAVEINEEIWYWLIDERCYETYDEV